MMRECPACNKLFVPPKKHSRQIYCSNHCYRNRIPTIIQEKECPTCDIVFMPRHPHQTYCSRICYKRRGPLRNVTTKFNGTEKIFFESVRDKVSNIYHYGLPDFLIEYNEKLVFVEVKSKKDMFNEKQNLVMNLLTSHGIDCFYFFEGIGLIPFNLVAPLIDFRYKKISTIYNKLIDIGATCPKIWKDLNTMSHT